MANRFDIWIKKSLPGESYVYHTGYTLYEDGRGKSFSNQVYSAREAWERGEIELVSRRLTKPKGKYDCGSFEWIAVKRETIAHRKKWLSREGQPMVWKMRPTKEKEAKEKLFAKAA